MPPVLTGNLSTALTSSSHCYLTNFCMAIVNCIAIKSPVRSFRTSPRMLTSARAHRPGISIVSATGIAVPSPKSSGRPDRWLLHHSPRTACLVPVLRPIRLYCRRWAIVILLEPAITTCARWRTSLTFWTSGDWLNAVSLAIRVIFHIVPCCVAVWSTIEVSVRGAAGVWIRAGVKACVRIL
jgi:hypothetical protein